MNGNNAADGRKRATAKFIEEHTLDVDFDRVIDDQVGERQAQYDTAYLQALKVTVGAVRVGEALLINDRWGGELIDEIRDVDAYAQVLSEAGDCGLKIYERAQHNQEIKYDLSRLDPWLLKTAQRNLEYVAPHLGVDLSLPDPTH